MVGSGEANKFKDWQYIVTQFHLFVMDAESKRLAGRAEDWMHMEHPMAVEPGQVHGHQHID
jgi:hypothetical protein